MPKWASGFGGDPLEQVTLGVERLSPEFAIAGASAYDCVLAKGSHSHGEAAFAKELRRFGAAVASYRKFVRHLHTREISGQRRNARAFSLSVHHGTSWQRNNY